MGKCALYMSPLLCVASLPSRGKSEPRKAQSALVPPYQNLLDRVLQKVIVILRAQSIEAQFVFNQGLRGLAWPSQTVPCEYISN